MLVHIKNYGNVQVSTLDGEARCEDLFCNTCGNNMAVIIVKGEVKCEPFCGNCAGME